MSKLSTCGICGGTITNERGAWQHIKLGAAHLPDPDDGWVENERALDDDADAYFDRVRNP